MPGNDRITLKFPKLMILRHAEKPIPGKSQGVRGDGRADASSLTALGWQRAGALVNFFRGPRAREGHLIERPNHLFAAKFDPQSDDPSRRSKQTLRPLSRALETVIQDRFGAGEETALVEEALKRSGAVLIAWSHEHITAIVEAIPDANVEVPSAWPDSRFDVIWAFEHRQGKWKFSQVPQVLLAGDLPEAIS